MLHGMAEPLQHAVTRLGHRLRLYAPVGELVPGMAYLVRRLLENTSNDSFVRHHHAEGHDLDRLIAAPDVDRLPERERRRPRRHRPRAARPAPARAAAGVAPGRRSAAAFAVAVDRAGERRRPRRARPHRRQVAHHDRTASTRSTPADPDRVVARSAACGPAEADCRGRGGHRRWPSGGGARPRPSGPPCCSGPRRGCGPGATSWRPARSTRRPSRGTRPTPTCARPSTSASTTGARPIRLEAGGEVESPPGEHNHLTYEGKGVTAVIAPWNFPLAIPCGMTSAALAAGNPAMLKPAEQTPGVAGRPGRGLRRRRPARRRARVPARPGRGGRGPPGGAPRRRRRLLHRLPRGRPGPQRRPLPSTAPGSAT